MRRALFLAVVLAMTLPLPAAYSGRDLVLPVVGRSAGSDGRLFDTSIWITNLSAGHPADVTLAFYQSGQTNRNPRVMTLHLRPGETWISERMDKVLMGGALMGALRVQSTQEVTASARTFSRMAQETNTAALGATFAAIPAQFAIGNDEDTTLQGITPADSRYKIYLVEVTGRPLVVTLQLLDPGGRVAGDASLYVDAHMHTAVDVRQLFGDQVPAYALLRVAGTNGDGRVVVAGAQIASQSQDASGYEMTLRTQPRNRLSIGEIVAYSLVAVALIAGAVFRLKSEE